MTEIRSPYFDKLNITCNFIGSDDLPNDPSTGDMVLTTADVQNYTMRVYDGTKWVEVSTLPEETKPREVKRIPSVRLCPSCNSPVDLKLETCPYCSVPYPMKEIFE